MNNAFIRNGPYVRRCTGVFTYLETVPWAVFLCVHNQISYTLQSAQVLYIDYDETH